MFRKVSVLLSVAGIVLTISGFATAQTAPVTGTVELKDAAGKSTPVANATIDVYRSDIKGTLPSATTGKNGGFTFAGLALGGQYIFSISCTGCQPQVFPGIKAGQQSLVFTVLPGDGRKLTEDESRMIAGRGKDGEPTADEKKAQADFEAKKKEVEEKNKKAESVNSIVNAALKAGNDAYTAKNYDLAIAKYEEGIQADPNFVGSAPIFHNNRGTALMTRAVDTYNKGVKATDTTEKVAALTAARKDFADSAADFMASLTVLKNAPASEISDKANFDAARMQALRGAKETFKMAVRTEQVDQSTIDVAKTILPEYIAAETDPAKKAEADLIFADLYRVVGDSPNAIAGYKKILETSPDNLDALAGVGLSLVNQGYIANDKAQLQEGANYLQKYAGIAPDGHKFKADAVALIEQLKKEQNVTPQKVTAPAKKRP
jgi:tetratricopeptide (TPR) repeat protein